jgi:hypothetical protein
MNDECGVRVLGHARQRRQRPADRHLVQAGNIRREKAEKQVEQDQLGSRAVDQRLQAGAGLEKQRLAAQLAVPLQGGVHPERLYVLMCPHAQSQARAAQHR